MAGAAFDSTRQVLHCVAVHVVARARAQATGRFGLRCTPGGFGTPAFGEQVEVVRVAGDRLVRELAGPSGSSTAACPIDGSSLEELAAFAGVDLDRELWVGDDTPPLPDRSAPLRVDLLSAQRLAEWYALCQRVLDLTVASRPGSRPSVVQLWPEHFDLAVDIEAAPGRRVNVGGSPGDAFHAGPYLYVGPWGEERPGDPEYWNAPFGALIDWPALEAAGDPVGAALRWVGRGLDLLGSPLPGR